MGPVTNSAGSDTLRGMSGLVDGFLRMTNATKAQIAAVVQATLGLLQVFTNGLSQEQWGAVETLVAALLAVWVAATYKRSRRRRQPVQTPPRERVSLHT